MPESLTRDTHPLYFKAFQKEFQFDYFDITNSNVDRVCFESYDPNIYVNPDPEVFDVEIIDEGFGVTEKPPILPVDNQDQIIERIMNFNWGKDFQKGERNNFIFDIAGAFCEYGISQSIAEGVYLE